jgi:hypothetical protein
MIRQQRNKDLFLYFVIKKTHKTSFMEESLRIKMLQMTFHAGQILTWFCLLKIYWPSKPKWKNLPYAAPVRVKCPGKRNITLILLGVLASCGA